jgi:hypothetical protein
MLQIASGSWRKAKGWTLDALKPELDSEQTLVVVFAANNLLDLTEVLADVASAYPNSITMGCSTAGEILQDSFFEDSLVVAAAKFEHTRLRLACAEIDHQHEGFVAGVELARQLEKDGLKAVFLLSNGHNVNGSELVRGVNSGLPNNVIVSGGLAGDGARFESTWVLRNKLPASDSVTAVGFYGDRVSVKHGCQAGWDKFGVERRVTRSKGNVLFELDGVPALDLYRKYLGEQADHLPAAALLFPLALRQNTDTSDQLIRTVLNIDEQNKAMIFAGDIPEGSLAQFMMANLDKLVDSAGDAASEASSQTPSETPSLSIAVTCVGRRLVLGNRTEDELEASLEMLPTGSSQIGFYSYGELSPSRTGECALHNQTMTLTVLAEN